MDGAVEVVRFRAGYERARTEGDLEQLFRDNLAADLAPFKRGGGVLGGGGGRLTIPELEDFVHRFNDDVPRHPLGEGNAALVVVQNGTVRVNWLRGQDNHWRVSCWFFELLLRRALLTLTHTRRKHHNTKNHTKKPKTITSSHASRRRCRARARSPSPTLRSS